MITDRGLSGQTPEVNDVLGKETSKIFHGGSSFIYTGTSAMYDRISTMQLREDGGWFNS